ncbi:MAG TPA: tetratricopeptide repeat protein, partial [Candidatus Eremiobacteraceae bacterium]|nr:tetratricopeptide repeat protein [Candidatus Eremiobacteraceae bacterium]
QIEARDFTLMVCTQAYQRRFMEDEPSGVGRGVVWEARILRNLLYEDSERHGRIVPLLLDGGARAFVPTVFRGHFYDVSDDRGFEGLLRHLLREPGAQAEALGALGPQGARWSAFERPWLVPDAMRTRYFTGRESLLAALRAQLTARHRAALSGLGGVGKTQAAFEYAVRHRADYPDGVFWTSAETLSAIAGGYVEIAKALRLAVAASSNQEQIVRATIEWLNGTERWLLILDNVDDRAHVMPFIPERGKGDVLITSRESVFQELGIARGLDVVDLDADEAVRFLYARTGRNADDDPAERSIVAELAAEMGHLPLALEQAAAYITETSANFGDYLTSYRKRRVALLEKASGLVSHDTVAVTWSANFDAVQRASAAAADILRASAFLAPDSVPVEIFSRGAASLGDAVARALPDPDDDLAPGELLRPLARYSLIRTDPRSRSFGVHRLVQEIVRESIAEPERRAHVGGAVAALDASLPPPSYETWVQYDRLVPHVLAAAHWIALYDLRGDAEIRILMQTGTVLEARARYSTAEPLYRQALSIREHLVGTDHPDVAATLKVLANTVWAMGRFGDAEVLHLRALDIVERTLGQDDLEVASLLNNLAGDRWSLGRRDEIRPLFERSLKIVEHSLGPDHLMATKIVNNLALLARHEGHDAESERLYVRALAIWERELGQEHPDVALCLNNLADVRVALGRLDEAQPMYERAIAIWEHSDHPNMASAIDGLATVYRKLGRLDEARKNYERAAAVSTRALGPEHPFVACSLVGLAQVHEARGAPADAIVLYERVLAIVERGSHPDLPSSDDLKRTLERLRAGSPA